MRSTIVVGDRLKTPLDHQADFLAYDDVRIIERLFSSSLTALVSNQAPRKLKVCHFKKGTEICSYSFANTILAVKLNRLVRTRDFYVR